MNKTITIARKDGRSMNIERRRLGWVMPPEEGYGYYIDGSGAYQECVARWKSHGWEVKREPNPLYRTPRLLSFK